MRTLWSDSFAWMLTVGAAVGLTLLAPTGLAVLGHLPAVATADLNQRPLSFPQDLPAERTLVFVTFMRGQSVDVDHWIQRMGLQENSAVAWMRLRVFDNDANEHRDTITHKMQATYETPDSRATVVPLFTDRETFANDLGLPSQKHMYAIVINREGHVLARAEGRFSKEKAAALLERLTPANDLAATDYFPANK
ncbi:MAG: hypothetical protein GAK30_02371 [Paracidovorax wautersii]|uniref:Cytochrome oxidase Cu insertion factor, SCO1/SenC/PrrC family n=1 Tax=Paracidovorax wautersii TaxID=1177982 RepID=A0A7V8JPV1_9BURK|nr:MAG: hypothetical protein GAK30_02371 [Paracidovorax wautersii]